MAKPILCLDFDGVLHSYKRGWMGAHIIGDPPVEGAVEFLQAASEHFIIAIFSSRSNEEGGIEAMKRWLARAFAPHNQEMSTRDHELLREIQWPSEKPPAMVTLDDRAITFTGEWPSVESLLAFKPWNAI